MRYPFFIFVLITALSSAQAQKPPSKPPAGPQVKLTLKVVDDMTGAGIASAQIDLTDFTHPIGDLFEGHFENLGEHVRVPVTDQDGQAIVLVEENSSLSVRARATDYPFSSSATSIQMTQSPMIVKVPLTRGAVIVGHIVDAESGRPLADIPVEARHLSFSHGIREFPYDFVTTKTDQDGRFEIRELRPGAYIVETNCRDGVTNWHIVPDSRYGRQEWPGGKDFGDALPKTISAGATVDFGTISLEKKDLATVMFRISGDCAGQEYSVSLIQNYATIQLWRGEAERGRTALLSMCHRATIRLLRSLPVLALSSLCLRSWQRPG